MKRTKKYYIMLVSTVLTMCAMIVGIYAVLQSVFLQSTGSITYKAFGCDVKVKGQITNAIKTSSDGSLYYNSHADYLEDMEDFIGESDTWTIGDISFDEESSLEIKPIIITLDVHNYSIFPIFTTLRMGSELSELLETSHIDVSATADGSEYVFGTEFYMSEAVYDSSNNFVSSTYKQFKITIALTDDSTTLEMASRVDFFDMVFEKTLKQYDNKVFVADYRTIPISFSQLEKTATTSTFNGWAGDIGQPEQISNIKFKVGARDIPITQINVILAETDRNGTLVASETIDVNIEANADEYVVWSLPETIINTEGKSYYFGYACNQYCNLFWYSGGNQINTSKPSMMYVCDLKFPTTFEKWWFSPGTEIYYRPLYVQIGQIAPLIEYKEKNFEHKSSTYTGSLYASYTDSTFSGWGGTIGAPENVSAIRFRVGARDNAITQINLFITENDKNGKFIAGIGYVLNIEPNTYKDIVWNLSKPIVGNTTNLFFSYTCDQYCNVYRGTTKSTTIQTVFDTLSYMSSPKFMSNSSTNFVMSVDFGDVYTHKVEEDEDNPTSDGILQTVDVHLANSYDLVVGDVFQMFYRGVIRAVNPYNYYIKVVCAKGNSFPRFWQFTPTESDVGTLALSILVMNDNGQLIGEDSTTLNIVNPMKNTTYATAKNILCVGDSLTAAGIWFKEGYRRFCMAGGTPAGLGNTDSLNFIGTKTVTVDGKTVGYEGVGGWSWATYLGSNSPFYNTTTSSIDFVNYCTKNGFAGIDEVYFLLTWNGFGAHYFDEYPTDTGNLKNAQTLIDTLKAQFPNVKVTCLGIPLSSLGGGTGTNYGTNSVYGDAYGIYMTAFAYNIALEKLCLSAKYSSFVRYVDTKAQFDGDYNYPTSDVPVNSRNPQTETIQSNGVHPNQYGYLQIGDAFYRALCSRYKAE